MLTCLSVPQVPYSLNLTSDTMDESGEPPDVSYTYKKIQIHYEQCESIRPSATVNILMLHFGCYVCDMKLKSAWCYSFSVACP